MRRLRSPLSEREWQAHDAILDIRNTHNDPEAIFVQAAPKEARTYLKLKRLLQGLQAELDSCWAVLGEVYGRFGALAKLGLVIRRVRSNLDEERAFAATVTYIPCEARFDAAGADLLKLLIQPLYGDTPGVGIRELMQNAVDACLELQDFLAQNASFVDPEQPDHSADVVITLERKPDGSRYVTVTDRGIGMTPEVVRDYFLKAGASFRRSDAWRQQHESETGESRVLRSGRFGVGALAAFLLGDEVEVSTRHVSAPKNGGVCFTATLDTDEIQLNHCQRPVGTTVRVKISADHIWSETNKLKALGRRENRPEPAPPMGFLLHGGTEGGARAPRRGCSRCSSSTDLASLLPARRCRRLGIGSLSPAIKTCTGETRSAATSWYAMEYSFGTGPKTTARRLDAPRLRCSSADHLGV